MVFWYNLYTAGLAIKGIVDAVAPYLFVINLAQTIGLAGPVKLRYSFLIVIDCKEIHPLFYML